MRQRKEEGYFLLTQIAQSIHRSSIFKFTLSNSFLTDSNTTSEKLMSVILEMFSL